MTGVIECSGGTLYCTVLFFHSNGELLGKHRKLMPTALERVVWGCGDGSTLTVVDTSLGKVGAVICWENYMPLLRTAMYAKGSSRTALRRLMIAIRGFTRCVMLPAKGGALCYRRVSISPMPHAKPQRSFEAAVALCHPWASYWLARPMARSKS